MFRQLTRDEVVEGYICENCKVSDKCQRSLKIKTLPPFLTIQLFRFVYDRQTGMF
jgi:ubiquitin C-terminal hydrolase